LLPAVPVRKALIRLTPDSLQPPHLVLGFRNTLTYSIAIRRRFDRRIWTGVWRDPGG
jgi:hypothetical protein